MISIAIKFISVQCPNCLANLEIDSSRSYTYCAYCGTKILLTNENEHIYRHIDEAKLKEAETNRLIRLQELKLKEMEIRSEQEFRERQLEEDRQAKLKKEEASKKRLKRILIAILIGVGIFLLIIVAIIVLCVLYPEIRKWIAIFGMFAFFVVMAIILTAFAGVLGLVSNLQEKGGYVGNIGNLGIRRNEVPMVIITSSMVSCVGKQASDVREAYVRAGFRNVITTPLNDLTLLTANKSGRVSSVVINGNRNCRLGESYPADARIVIYYHSKNGPRL